MFQRFEWSSRSVHVRIESKIESIKISNKQISKWFQDSIGHVGLNKMLDGFNDRSAYALCTFAYCEGPEHEPIIFEGKTPVSFSYKHNSFVYPNNLHYIG
jgi:hypothetical protein